MPGSWGAAVRIFLGTAFAVQIVAAAAIPVIARAQDEPGAVPQDQAVQEVSSAGETEEQGTDAQDHQGADLDTVPVAPLAQDDPQARAQGQTTVLDAVVVTVNKRSEYLKDIASSVSAYSGATLQQNNVQNYTALADLVPNMRSRGENTASEASITIRGIGRARQGKSPVAFHVNGIFLGDRGAPFYDLQSVEVLRGPSGTVFGRNATAGAVNVKWMPPSPLLAYGSDYRFDTLGKQLRGYVNTPLPGPGSMAVRFAAFTRETDGDLDNLLQPDDRDPGNAEENFVRMFFSADPLDNLHVNLRAIRYRSDSSSTNVVFSPSLHIRRSGHFEQYGAMPLPDDLTKVRSRLSERYGLEPYSKSTGIDGDLSWRLEDLPGIGDMNVDFVLAQQETSADILYDLDGTDAVIVEGISFVSGRKQSGELRFSSDLDVGVQYLVGLFWFRENAWGDSFVDLNIPLRVSRTLEGFFPFPPFLIGSPADEDVPLRSYSYVNGNNNLFESTAAFAHVTLNLETLFDLPGIAVFAGLRENRDTELIRFDESVFEQRDPATGATVQEVSRVDNGYYPGSYGATTGEIGAKWIFSDDSMVYLKFARGYKAGLTQPQGETINHVKPEILDALELGLKSAFSFSDQRLITNISAFGYDYTDLQVHKITGEGVTISNAGAAILYGLELEARWIPTANANIQTALAWLHTEFLEFCGRDDEMENEAIQPGCTEQRLPHNFKGETLADAPEYSASILATYSLGLGNWGSLMPVLKSSWVDDYQRREYGNPIDLIEGYSNTSLRLVWASPTGTIKVESFVEQIEDHDDIFYDQFTLPAPGNYTMVGMNPRRYFGIGMEAAF